MRLIDAESLKHELIKESENKSILARRSLFWIIDDMPTIEAEPVRVGHWIWKNLNNYIYVICSVCGAPFIDYIFEDFDYCPTCGAKMENEDE